MQLAHRVHRAQNRLEIHSSQEAVYKLTKEVEDLQRLWRDLLSELDQKFGLNPVQDSAANRLHAFQDMTRRKIAKVAFVIHFYRFSKVSVLY